ncbi:ANTAR domain-containing protein [Kitasatospora purpeofusca]|uniref:ANTAR domain-containing protein n=1 Tax=Kitasatospora purpeofusca TaxID=67352 RepID=UPI002A5A91E8|nr:ANTAR domain-containing protein [Kitasatospora purpeofusca]MDY0814542.1 ANTAR domain-containing protein [Kitasatospora purpeofusca]
MPLVNLAALQELVAELDQLPVGDPGTPHRTEAIHYALGVYTGTSEPAEAVRRARDLLRAAPPPATPPGPAAPPAPLPRSTPLDDVLADLAATVPATFTPQRTLDDVLRLTTVLVPSCAAAGVTRWRPDGTALVLASTSPAHGLLDRLQIGTGRGPVVDARATVDGTATAAFGPAAPSTPVIAAAGRYGIRSAVAVVLASGFDHHTTLSLYLRTPHTPGPTVRRLAAVHAAHARIALDHADLARAVAHLLDRRRRTGRAVGILMERHGLTPLAALDLLVRGARQLDTDLPTLVAHLLDSTERVPPTGP